MEDLIFKAIISALLSLCLLLLKRGMDSIQKMQKSVQDLNIHIAQLVERDLIKEKQLDKIEDRVDGLEKTIWGG